MEAMRVEPSSNTKRYLNDEERAEAARSMARLKNEITELAGHLNAANHRFLMLIAEFDLPTRLVGRRDTIVCTLVELEVRDRHWSGAREGSCCTCIGRLTKDLGIDGER
jgi:hypothetical protein